MDQRVISWAVTALIPLALVCLGVTALFTPAFVNAEYASGRLSGDQPGVDREERGGLAATTVRAVGPVGSGTGSLRDLTSVSTNRPLYSERELAHLGDVAAVSRAVGITALLSTIAVVAGIGWLVYRPATRRSDWLALRGGGLATVGVAVLAGVLALTAFDQLFAAMHAVFFAPGSFVFAPGDALIRLFPERLFADAAVILGGWMLVVGAAMAALGWRLGKADVPNIPLKNRLSS